MTAVESIVLGVIIAALYIAYEREIRNHGRSDQEVERCERELNREQERREYAEAERDAFESLFLEEAAGRL